MREKKVKKVSKKQEIGVAKDLNAKTVVASGAMWNAKSDVRNDLFLIECKTTGKDYYVVTSKVWEKICREAVRDHFREPLLVIDLKDSDKERYVVFPSYLLYYIETPKWLRGNIYHYTGDAKSFQFKGNRKHCITLVDFKGSKRKFNYVAIMKMKDFQRLMQEEHLEEVMRSQMTGGNE